MGGYLRLGLITILLLLPGETAKTMVGMSWRVIVNGNGDQVTADGKMTFREAIALVNGTLSLEQLSPQEREQVSISGDLQRIEFNLPPAETTIELRETLPDLIHAVIIDGTTQPGYGEQKLSSSFPERGKELSTVNWGSSLNQNDRKIPQPIVTLEPQRGKIIERGLTIVADQITVRGLRLNGFATPPSLPSSTPRGAIFISHSQVVSPEAGDIPPQKITIEYNAIGTPNYPSAFGVYVFNGKGVKIYRNFIGYNLGSGIISGVRAQNLVIQENLLQNNGFEGMPDAIRLEGEINDSIIEGNLIRDNAGSGVYVFKPIGSVNIYQNILTDNGRKIPQAAIYLMGSNHQVQGNIIKNQPGAGVAIASFPPSTHININHNRFAHLQGLSIDLVVQGGTTPLDYQQGDGLNPPFLPRQQQQHSANFGINAPRFISREFFHESNGNVTLFGEAEPESLIEIYRVTEADYLAGPLEETIATTYTDQSGRFTVTLEGFKGGVGSTELGRVSAIATHPHYGTSEPALNAVIRPLIH